MVITNLELSQEQKEGLVGNLLGDAHLSALQSGNKNSRLSINQKLDNSEYVKYLYQFYLPFSSYYSEGAFFSKKYNKKYFYCRMLTPNLPVFTELRNKWYVLENGKNRKIVPNDISLTWKTLAFWALDDGYNDYKNRRFTFSTDGFTKKEVLFLISLLKENLNLKSLIRNHCGYYEIDIFSKDYKNLIYNIKPYLENIKCLNYKINFKEYLRPNVSGHIGINLINGIYVVRVSQNNKRIYLGSFKTIEEAIEIKNKFNENPENYNRENKLRLNNTSGIEGVHYHNGKNKWIAKINKIHVGTFKTKDEAILAIEARKLMLVSPLF